MNIDLLTVSLRQQAVYIPEEQKVVLEATIDNTTLTLIGNLRKIGYTVSEPLLKAINSINPAGKSDIFDVLNEIKGLYQNWTPLVKAWDTPTGESIIDHLVTLFANALCVRKGTRLACGHLIPEGTFPLERYNGCPFCGTPFQFGVIENYGQGSKLRMLDLWGEEEMKSYLVDLLESRTPLDASQLDSLEILLREFPLPQANVVIKEINMLIIDSLVEKNQEDKAQVYFNTPNDVLRYLWYTQTGYLQIVNPKTVIRRYARNHRHQWASKDKREKALAKMTRKLKLNYSRTECRIAATWLNNLDMDVRKACEIMHPKRAMWVRFIRALRLADYAKRRGFENLRELIDIFYNQTYSVVQGELDSARLKMNAKKAFAVLKQRPGLFARSLFSTMLWFGADKTLAAFEEIVDKIPARLILTLNMYASYYFNPNQGRIIKPLGETPRVINSNRLLQLYSNEELEAMKAGIEKLCAVAVSKRFAAIPTESKTIYVDPMLFNIPLAIGDRNETIQDTSCALMGTRFVVEGNSVRLFMHWGKGLKAQALDMDLSAGIVLPDRTVYCSFYNLVVPGAKHSGDIRSIPDLIGTAEYVELDMAELNAIGAKYVLFTCNAYSNGSLSPNMMVGWMNSAHPMQISEETGVAYDPSCIQHQVRISKGLTKGLVFGVLDVPAREIMWLEVPFDGQLARNLCLETVTDYLVRLKAKTTIGQLLSVKAEAQGLTLTETPAADETYTMDWAMNTAAVTKLLFD